MVIDEIILAGRKLKSFIEKLEPKILKELTANSIRTNENFNDCVDTINKINIDAFILIIRYYGTLSIDYRPKLILSLSLDVELTNTSYSELISYTNLPETKKIIFEIIYTLTLLEGCTEA